MTNQLSWYTILELYRNTVRQELNEEKAKHHISEIESAIIRILLRLMGFSHQPQGRKLTAEDKQIAFEYMKNLSVEQLPQALILLEEKGHTFPLSASSLSTYCSRARAWLAWARENGYWTQCRYKSQEIQEQCSPKFARLYGSLDNFHLTDRRGVYSAYALKRENAPQQLRKWYKKTFDFLVQVKRPGRCFGSITDAAAEAYLTRVDRIFGWFVNYEEISFDDLTPDLIFPKITKDRLQKLSRSQQRELWREKQLALETWLCDYRDFLSFEMVSRSPHTWKSILSAVQMIGRVQYADWVELEADYSEIPLFKTLNKEFQAVFKELDEWHAGGESVVDFSRKWPEVPEGSTALEEVQQHVVEPLRLECRPRDYRGEFRNPHNLARKYQHFLKMGLLGLSPPRRSQDDRMTKFACSCPAFRPDFVPADGLYYPLPPDSTRSKDRRGKVSDSYLYRTYQLKGRIYPDGVWVRNIQGYKTQKKHGVFEVILPNRRFGDRRCFYDYLEEYLEGIWLPGPFRNGHRYGWWDPAYQGQRGRWLTAGRAEFNPTDVEVADVDGLPWRLGYLIVGPKSGGVMGVNNYAKSIRSNSFRLIGKKLTPHTFRYLWATWGIQAGLSDAELQALAYMMGHDVATLRRIYQRCTPSEQQQIIEEAINERLSRPLSDSDDNQNQTFSVEQLFKMALKTNRDELWQLYECLRVELLGPDNSSDRDKKPS